MKEMTKYENMTLEGPVLGYIKTDNFLQVSKYVQHFFISTRFAPICTVPNSMFLAEVGNLCAKIAVELFVFLDNYRGPEIPYEIMAESIQNLQNSEIQPDACVDLKTIQC